MPAHAVNGSNKMRSQAADLLETCSDYQGLLEKMLSCIQQVIIVTDLEGKILFASKAVGKVLGFTPDELVDKDLSVIFTPEDLTYLYSNLLHLARDDKPFEGEIMLIRKDETRFLAFMAFRSHLTSAYEKSVIVISIQDIDKRKQLEKSFHGTHYEDLIKIANGIAHEIRNPLMSIGGFASRIYKSCKATDDHRKYYDYIINNLKRIEGLVRKVELFARVPKPRLTEEPVKELIEKAIQPYLKNIKEKNIDLAINIDETNLFVDPGLVISALSMLIENALDALPESGSLLIKSEIKENQCGIYFIDSGTGISTENLPFIFNPFFSTKADRAGIDLPVVKKIIEGHGGQIEVSSKPGEGTTCVLKFPLERRRAIRISRL
jgi:PAS domain S-box-containing protein